MNSELGPRPPTADRGEQAAVVMASDDTAPASSPVDDTPGRPADDRAELCVGTDAVHLQNPLVSADCNQADNAAACEAKTPVDHTELVPRPPADERQGEPEVCAGDAGVARPLEGTLMARILELIEASDRPKRPWQIQKELRLARMPSAELSRLLTMGCLIRPKEGIYAVPGRHYGASVSSEGNQS